MENCSISPILVGNGGEKTSNNRAAEKGTQLKEEATMAFITTGLTKNAQGKEGVTAHYNFSYDSSFAGPGDRSQPAQMLSLRHAKTTTI